MKQFPLYPRAVLNSDVPRTADAKQSSLAGTNFAGPHESLEVMTPGQTCRQSRAGPETESLPRSRATAGCRIGALGPEL